MEKKTKQNLLIVIVGVGLFAALMNLRAVILFLEKGIGDYPADYRRRHTGAVYQRANDGY